MVFSARAGRAAKMPPSYVNFGVQGCEALRKRVRCLSCGGIGTKNARDVVMDSGYKSDTVNQEQLLLGGSEMKLPRRKGIKVGKLIRCRNGQSLVEFAMVAPLFFLLVFGITDFGRLFYTQETLQFAMREAGRFAVTGRKLTVGNTTYARVESIKRVAQQAAVGLIPDTSAISVSSVQGGLLHPAGGPRQTVVISLTTTLKFITPMIGKFFGSGQSYTFTVSTTFMNEPFDPSQTD